MVSIVAMVSIFCGREKTSEHCGRLQLLEAGGAQPAVRGAHRVFASRSSFLDAGARAVEAAHLAAEQPEASGA